jgi:hypothetical protein
VLDCDLHASWGALNVPVHTRELPVPLEAKPGLHAHVVAPLLLLLPAGHAAHCAAPATGLYVLAWQTAVAHHHQRDWSASAMGGCVGGNEARTVADEAGASAALCIADVARACRGVGAAAAVGRARRASGCLRRRVRARQASCEPHHA